MTTLHTALLDIVALVGGGITERQADDPQLSRALDSVVNDLRASDSDDVLTAFLGITLGLVDRLAQHTGETPEEYWNQTAAGLSARLAEQENQA
ncbi:hypothetical protein ABZ517_30160 [Streptomyces scabiei]|uniref:hypothetical protein n=1 Tax=Streptomyces scabiei TaxID=1930 RepID=UPI0033D63423